jgi:ADP-ribose pyrophosphatase
VIEDWAWLVTPDYINVAAFTPAGQLLCFRQVKYAVEGETLAPVGGFIEPGEDPLTAAKRELLEETGYTASEWTGLGRYAVDANRGAGTAHFFLARGARQTAQPGAGDLEEQELLLLERPQVQAALREGRFKALSWAAIISLALAWEINP